MRKDIDAQAFFKKIFKLQIDPFVEGIKEIYEN